MMTHTLRVLRTLEFMEGCGLRPQSRCNVVIHHNLYCSYILYIYHIVRNINSYYTVGMSCIIVISIALGPQFIMSLLYDLSMQIKYQLNTYCCAMSCIVSTSSRM